MGTKKNRNLGGRPSLYGTPMVGTVAVRFNEEQGQALAEWCRRKQISPATVVRESGLLRAGAKRLGLGLASKEAKTVRAITLDGATIIPIKLTQEHIDALTTYCERKGGLKISHFLREATLDVIGKAKLGVLSELKALQSAATK